MVNLIICWILYLVLESFTKDIKNHKMLKKNFTWVFIPFIANNMNRTSSDLFYTISTIVLILAIISARKRSVYSYTLLTIIITYSAYYVVTVTKIHELLKSLI